MHVLEIHSHRTDQIVMAVVNRKELVGGVVEASEVFLAAGLCVRQKSLVAEAHR